MKVHVKHTLKTDVATSFKLATEQKHQETIYAQLGGSDLKIKREGRAPNVTLRISRTEPSNPPAAKNPSPAASSARRSSTSTTPSPAAPAICASWWSTAVSGCDRCSRPLAG